MLANKNTVLVTAGGRSPVMGYWDLGPDSKLTKSIERHALHGNHNSALTFGLQATADVSVKKKKHGIYYTKTKG